MTSATTVRRQRSSPPRLRITVEARPHVTPFRRRVLRLMYETAAADLGDRLKSATVSLWRSMEEEAQNLVLTLAADIPQRELEPVGRSIAEVVARSAASWSDAQKEDFRHWVYFELWQSPD